MRSVSGTVVIHGGAASVEQVVLNGVWRFPQQSEYVVLIKVEE